MPPVGGDSIVVPVRCGAGGGEAPEHVDFLVAVADFSPFRCGLPVGDDGRFIPTHYLKGLADVGQRRRLAERVVQITVDRGGLFARRDRVPGVFRLKQGCAEASR